MQAVSLAFPVLLDYIDRRTRNQLTFKSKFLIINILKKYIDNYYEIKRILLIFIIFKYVVYKINILNNFFFVIIVQLFSKKLYKIFTCTFAVALA